MDFDTAVLAGPDTDGDCGTANDELTITSPSTTIPGVANLCGTLTGQHCKLFRVENQYFIVLLNYCFSTIFQCILKLKCLRVLVASKLLLELIQPQAGLGKSKSVWLSATIQWSNCEMHTV